MTHPPQNSAPPRRSPDEYLYGTPYLVPEDTKHIEEFARIIARSKDVAGAARRVSENIRQQAEDVFETFGLTLRSELVAESNQMEHLSWTAEQVRDVVYRHRDLLSLPVHSFIQGLRGDAHTYQALGLYKAQEIAEEWASQNQRPNEVEIRQLHWVVTQGEAHAGGYKKAPNRIAGAKHIPPQPADAAESMRQLSAWLANGTGDPVLDATVAHAWMAHLHAFEDGNGRIARLIANLALSQGGYPPLILSAAGDRGEYYDALAESDDGNILPLFSLFGRVLRRGVRLMSAPDYAEKVIRERALSTEDNRHRLWTAVAKQFLEVLSTHVQDDAMETLLQGYPTPTAFHALANYHMEGNGWFTKVMDTHGEAQWLLWFGYNSQEFRDEYPRLAGYPSIFLSTRSLEGAPHPFTPFEPTNDQGDCSEIVLIPGRQRPVLLREGYIWSDYSLDDGAYRLTRTLGRWL